MNTAAARQVNRAELIDRAFVPRLRELAAAIEADPARLRQWGLTEVELVELFDSQLLSRHLDLMARVLRLGNRVFYTIGSAGHEGNAMVGRAVRHTDPAFLHYRSGALMMERSRQVEGIDPVYDTALSFAASAYDPASGGRHKVWGSRPLWVLPQTSTIASHLPKAVGAALAIEHAPRIGHPLPVPEDSIVLCSFGDASVNHSTAQGAFNAALWAWHQGLRVPLLLLCEDNGWGISVRSPAGWIERSMRHRPGLHYLQADGLDVAQGWHAVAEAVRLCRVRRSPVFLHLRVERLMGHAGTDFEVDYRTDQELAASEARDPLLVTARRLLEAGVLDVEAIVDRYEAARRRCFEAAARADATPKLQTRAEVMRPLAPYDAEVVAREAGRAPSAEARSEAFGGTLPEDQAPRHLAVNINRGLHDLLVKYPEMVLFGEDVARKGGVYTVTRGLLDTFSNRRVFNTLLDEQTILGLAQGYGTFGLLPVPEIQYLAYLHNACDQLRGEACSLQFFSNGQFENPLVVRIAALGYQKGFGGHFHNDNSVAALRDIPGLVVACPSRGDDAVMMLRTLLALARCCGRVSAFLEPIALYMTKDLHEPNDGAWCFPYPAPDRFVPLGAPRVYAPEADELAVVTFGNGVPMSLRAMRRLGEASGAAARVIDLRWLAPLDRRPLLAALAGIDRVLVVDEGRSAGVGEGVVSILSEELPRLRGLTRVAGADSYTPLGAAASTVLPSENDILHAALTLLDSD